MKIGLYSITYLGCWYRGEALTLPELVRIAKGFGYAGVEIDGKRPHGNPLDWPARRCKELRVMADSEGIDFLISVRDRRDACPTGFVPAESRHISRNQLFAVVFLCQNAIFEP